MSVLHQKLNQAQRRIRVLLVYRWAARLLCWTALACLAWLLVSKLNWVETPSPESVATILGAAALVGIGLGFAVRLTPADVARLTDRRTSMKERLGSAVEFEAAAIDDPLVRRQIEDARAHAQSIDLRRVYPVKVSREAAAFLVLTAVLFGSFFLPNLPIFWSAERKHEMEEVKKQGIAIEKVARETEKTANQQKLDESKKAAEEARKLGQAMKRGNLDKKQALIHMQKLTRNIQEQQKRMAALNSPAMKPLDKAAEEIKRALQQQQKAVEDAAQSKKEQAAKSQGKPGDKKGEQRKPAEQQQSKSMQMARQALQKFAQALADQNPQMQNQALQQLADQLQNGQMSKGEMQQLQQQLKAMSQALSKTEMDKVAKQLAELAKLMEQMKLDPETLKKLAQAMRQAGGT